MPLGRSWRGRKIQVNKAKFQASGQKVVEEKGAYQGAVEYPHEASIGVAIDKEWQRKVGTSPKGVAGWTIEEGKEKGVRVASWVAEEEKKALLCSLMGFLQVSKEGTSKAEHWMKVWDWKPINIKRFDELTVRMHTSTEEEFSQR